MQRKVKLKYLVVAVAMVGVAVGNLLRPATVTRAEEDKCPSLRVVFARGSGEERWEDQNYLAYKNTIEEKIRTTGIDYEFIDLDYPAVAVGLSNMETTMTTLGAYIGSGEVYKFGESVATGVNNLTNLVNNECSETKYVIGGYSQGAIVVSKSLANLKSEKLIYAATFGDPKIYLPEGEGVMPAACRNENLSDYRMYVPDCQAYKGMLGAVIPYEPESLAGKVGTWCNKYDILCSSRLNIFDHVAYVTENLYEDAAKVINAKITNAFGVKNNFTSLHDTAIVIDSTNSMEFLIEEYKDEAMRLAQETFQSGGRIALYDYRDLVEAYNPVEHCGFMTCTMESVAAGLEEIGTDGGDDIPESLLSATLHVMQEQKWRQGATKSIVVLTNANFHNPDLDGTTMDAVVALSKSIDPVNFYIITTEEYADAYRDLARRTDGKVITDFNSLNLLTDYIMERYDSLPRVDERSASEIAENRPTLNVINVADEDETVEISFETDGEGVIVTINDALLGQTNITTLTIGELDRTIENVITLTPVRGDLKGESVSVKLTEDNNGKIIRTFEIPKAPNTGRGRLAENRLNVL